MKAKEQYTTSKTGLFNNETLFHYTYIAHNGMTFKTTGTSLEKCRKEKNQWLFRYSATFTGHRFLRHDYHTLYDKLKAAIENSYQHGIRFFYAGGAVGFDTLAAEAVLSVKKQYADIVLIIVVPFPQQDKLFNVSDRHKYLYILNMADEVVTISNEFSNIAYFKRNDYMISHSCQLIAYWDEKSLGGTSYTVKKAREKKLTICNLFF